MHAIVQASNLSAKHSRILIAGIVIILFFCCRLPAMGQTASSATDADDWKEVEAAMGRSGQMQSGGVIRFGMLRKDLRVALNGVEIKPGLALGSWAAFKRDATAAMVMGDLVLTEEEVGPVMMKLQEGGIHESAVHNHLIGEVPRVMYMHIASHGDAVQMARRSSTSTCIQSPAGAGYDKSRGVILTHMRQLLQKLKAETKMP